MLTIGLTGGIGSGKSTVARRLAGHGAMLIDADRVAREVVAPNTPGLHEVVDIFGADVLDQTAALDRARLAGIVFADDDARRRLNAVVHPLVRQRTAELIAAAPAGAVVVNDVPLLVENGLAPAYHLVVVVEAPAEQRVDRLTRDRAMSAADARARVAAQATDSERRQVADVVLANIGGLDRLQDRVDELWWHRIAPYADNLRHRRTAGSPTAVLAPYDDAWPRQYQRLADRICHVLGHVPVDHIGSTAVPGLAAKDVIDLQLTVYSMQQADELRPALEAAGFPAVPAMSDRAKPPELGRWAKRVHGAADPGRPANLHLRVTGSPGWRYALLFRDWLRAEPAEQAAYEQAKRRLAADHPARADYAAAKEPWFDAALPRAQEFAHRTGWQPTG